MTLALAIIGRDSVWTVADRRITFANRRSRDDARKIMFLETTDSSVTLSYAGLGVTAEGTEPADWMSAVLRGRSMPLEQTLGALAEAMQREMPTHVAAIGPGHFVVVAGHQNEEERLYTIELRVNADGSSKSFALRRHVMDVNANPQRSTRIGIAGSGAPVLMKDQRWVRPALRLITKYERQELTPEAVADHLAALNQRVSGMESSVGPDCIVVYRDRKGAHATRLGPGKGVFSYHGADRQTNAPNLPLIANGMNVGGMIDEMMPPFLDLGRRFVDGIKNGSTGRQNFDEVWAAAERAPQEPDESLN